MTATLTKENVLVKIERDLEYHPGDAPWSCLDCYHGRPCQEKEILLAARELISVAGLCEERIGKAVHVELPLVTIPYVARCHFCMNRIAPGEARTIRLSRPDNTYPDGPHSDVCSSPRCQSHADLYDNSYGKPTPGAYKDEQ